MYILHGYILNGYTSTYVILLILPVDPQRLKSLLSDPLRETVNNENQILSSHIRQKIEFSILSIENDCMKSLFYEEMIKEYVSRECRGTVLQICVKKLCFLMLVLNVTVFVYVSAYKFHNSLCFIFSFKINIYFQTSFHICNFFFIEDPQN